MINKIKKITEKIIRDYSVPQRKVRQVVSQIDATSLETYNDEP